MTTDAKKIEIQKAALDGAEIERNPVNWAFQWELAPLPIEWNWADFEFRVVEPKPVSAFNAWYIQSGLIEFVSRLHAVEIWNASNDAVIEVLPGGRAPDRQAILQLKEN